MYDYLGDLKRRLKFISVTQAVLQVLADHGITVGQSEAVLKNVQECIVSQSGKVAINVSDDMKTHIKTLCRKIEFEESERKQTSTTTARDVPSEDCQPPV